VDYNAGGMQRSLRVFAAVSVSLASSLAHSVSADAPRDALTFAYGDVFANELQPLSEQLSAALGLAGGWDTLSTYGQLTPRGVSFGLSGPGVAALYFIVPSSALRIIDGVAARRIEVVAAAANGAPRWSEVSHVVHVTRPLTASTAQHVALIERLVGVGARAVNAGAPRAVGAGGARAAAPTEAVVAHGLLPTDLTPGTLSRGPGAGAFEVLRQEHRARRALGGAVRAVPAADTYARATLTPGGAAGLRVAVRPDTTYDVPGIALGRVVLDFEWSATTAEEPWVGFALDLRGPAGQPLDVATGDAALLFSVRGETRQPDGAARLFVALEDMHAGTPGGLGNEAHLAIDLPELTSMEQTVSLPLGRFLQVNPALDLRSLVHLKFAARDANVPGSTSCLAGDVELFDPRFVRDSPARRTPQNVFWSNEPLAHARGGAGAPLALRFIDQPTSVYKWFVGVAGPNAASVPGLLAEIAAVRATGRTPHVVMELWPSGGHPPIEAIAAGAYDAYFDALLEGCRDLGGRIELAPLHEANGFWYPWSSLGNSGRLRDAWRRIDSRRDALAAHNVALCYVVSNLPGDRELTRRAIEAFPGDDVVDLIGLQGFESGYDLVVDSFNELFTNIGAALDAVSDLPIVVTEYGFHALPNAEHGKGQLYRWALEDQLAGRTAAPFMGAFCFNVAKQENGAWRDWRVVQNNSSEPLPELSAWYPGLVGLAARPNLASGDGAEAHLAALRAHTRFAARFAPR